MGLHKIEPPSFDNFSVVQDQPPIFLIPGILGNLSEFKNLISSLYKLNEGKNAIFAYQDTELSAFSNDSTIESISTSIAEEMIQSIPGFKPFPFYIVGYSYGCVIAVYIAQLLKNAGHDPHVILIDGPSPQASKNYFSLEKNSNAKKDLIAIVNYAAEISLLKPVVFNDKTISELPINSFDACFDAIIKIILSQQDVSTETSLNAFNCFVQGAKQKLKDLIFNEHKILTMLEKIHLILTEETQAKYRTTTMGGWEDFAKEVINITSDDMSKQSHQVLLTEHEKNHNRNCEKIAEMIYQIFSNMIKKEWLFMNELLWWLSIYSKHNPEVSATAEIANFIQTKLNTASNANTPISTTPNASPKPSRMSDQDDMEIETEKPIIPKPKSTKSNHKFGMFDGNEMETDLPYRRSTRQTDKERADRLGSPSSSHLSSPGPRSPSSPRSK